MLVFEINKQDSWVLPSINYWFTPNYSGYEDLAFNFPNRNYPANWQCDFSRFINNIMDEISSPSITRGHPVPRPSITERYQEKERNELSNIIMIRYSITSI